MITSKLGLVATKNSSTFLAIQHIPSHTVTREQNLQCYNHFHSYFHTLLLKQTLSSNKPAGGRSYSRELSLPTEFVAVKFTIVHVLSLYHSSSGIIDSVGAALLGPFNSKYYSFCRCCWIFNAAGLRTYSFQMQPYSDLLTTGCHISGCTDCNCFPSLWKVGAAVLKFNIETEARQPAGTTEFWILFN
ncbi:uncharacterized protein LOC141679848 [Apium graveolens]|uniref:uncharacterized protein LOC141679848 n=1 Tax=Apium graveolens TaxID=4045 RepID=UPI003D7B3444